MNPALFSSFELALPDEILWLAGYLGFLGIGCVVLCALGLALLATEARSAWRSGSSTSTTSAAEFMGLGIPKERCPVARLQPSAPKQQHNPRSQHSLLPAQ